MTLSKTTRWHGIVSNPKGILHDTRWFGLNTIHVLVHHCCWRLLACSTFALLLVQISLCLYVCFIRLYKIFLNKDRKIIIINSVTECFSVVAQTGSASCCCEFIVWSKLIQYLSGNHNFGFSLAMNVNNSGSDKCRLIRFRAINR